MISAELQEEITNQRLPVSGKIPHWVTGTLLRNGPVTVTVNGKSNDHWFDGLAMLHAFSFSKGNIQYTNRFLRTNAYRKVFEEGSLHYDGFAIDPCRFLFKRFFTFFFSAPELHNANVNIAKLAEQYVALTETPLPVKFDPKTLETLGVFNYQDQLPKDRCWESAHPHHNFQQQETINYLVEYGRTSYYVLYRIKNGSSTREVFAKIPVEQPSYMHSFSVTENYVIFTEYPYLVKPYDLLTKGKAFIKNFSWHPEVGTKFLIVDKNNGQVVGRYSADPFFAFHHANAFEQNGDLQLDIVVYEDPLFILDAKKLLKTTQAHLERFTISPQSGHIRSKLLLQRSVEFPRIHEAFDGRPYRYLYLADPLETPGTRPLYKIDTSTQQIWQWSEMNCYPGEPVFAAAPQGKTEDDGVILAVIRDTSKHSSFLLILDAVNFEEIGRAQVPHLIPTGLHGQFFS